MKAVLLAFQFLTIVPVKVKGEITDENVGGSAAFFPVVGAFQGVLAAVSVLLLTKFLAAEIVAGIVILILILSNGGFDLDGLADTVDGLAVKSSGDPSRDRTRRLSVMKDSTIGAMGVIALVLAILLKFIVMKNLLAGVSTLSAAAVVFLMPVFSKWITVPAMYHAVPARTDGLGKIFIEQTRIGAVIVSGLLVIVLVLAASFVNSSGPANTRVASLCAFFLPASYLFALAAVKFFMKRFGGMTGDNFGALTEISEICFLFTAYLWVR